MEIFIRVAPVALGFLLDFLLGDPHGWPHPVRFIGNAISTGESFLRKKAGGSNKKLFWYGALLSVVIVLASYVIPLLILAAAGRISFVLRFVLETLFCYQILAARSLRDESMKVYEELKRNDLVSARKALSMIVGRDTEELDEEQTAKAAIETVAENCSDGVVAPLFFMCIGGAPLGFLYKAINTLDSMIAYKNEKYFYFGKFAAWLDDAANYIPARISGGLMLLVGALMGREYSFSEGLRIYRRDKRNHSSPNSAHTEAACAGLMGLKLAGSAYYGGKLVEKLSIGDGKRPVSTEDILSANRLMYGTATLGLVIFLCAKIFFDWS